MTPDAALPRAAGGDAPDAAAAVSRRYDRFARLEAPGRSALYARWAAQVAADPAASAVLARIAPEHRQPPLVFAVARLLGAGEEPDLAGWIGAHADALVAECGRRSVQTNEPLRCAALLPALALVEGPIALLELGASAGLCLYPDRYRYRYRYALTDGDVVALDPPDAPSQAPVLACAVRGERMPPVAVPQIVWRAGVDLHPLDAGDPADRSWLETLVWPGETGRRERIRRALDVVAADPPLMLGADAVDGCARLAALAPRDATLVVTTPGLLAHVAPDRRALVEAAARGAGRWITIDRPAASVERFVLAMDGEVLADVDPLGGWLEWLPGAGPAAG